MQQDFCFVFVVIFFWTLVDLYDQVTHGVSCWFSGIGNAVHYLIVSVV